MLAFVIPLLIASFLLLHYIVALFVVVLCLYLLVHLSLCGYTSKQKPSSLYVLAQGYSFLLGTQGQCVFDSASKKRSGVLSQQSRVNGLGCWLTVKEHALEESGVSPSYVSESGAIEEGLPLVNRAAEQGALARITHGNLSHYFIAKAQLSEQDYARLSRTISYVKNNQE